MYEYRQMLNYRQGTLSTALGGADLSMKSAQFVTFPTDLSTTKYVPVSIGDSSSGAFEVVWATAHAAGTADTLTIVRAREGTAAGQQWIAGTAWYVGSTERDLVATVATRTGLPADAHVGCRAWILDENTLVEKTFAQGWQAVQLTNPANYIGSSGAVPANRLLDERYRRVSLTTDSSGYFSATVPNGPYPTACLTAWTQLGSGGAGVSTVLDGLDPSFARFRVNRQAGTWASSDAIVGHVFFKGY